MKWKKSSLFTLVLVVIAAFIHIYSGDATRVENQYATRVYPAFSRFLRHIFGWLPFSLGDILYGLIIIWLIWKITGGIKALVRSISRGRMAQPVTDPGGGIQEKTGPMFANRETGQRFNVFAGKLGRVLLIIYILFNACWGINYNRSGIAGQLQLNIGEYSLEDLSLINGLLVEKVNTTKQVLVNQGIKYPSNKQLFSAVTAAYQQAEAVYPFLKYQPVSLKPSLWSWAGNYLGFTGYYDPFTGEAQVNTLVPKFLQPFIGCHEVAHQLGYAKEMEASFVGYLAATSSRDTLLQYSVYLDLFIYSNRNLFDSDSTAALSFAKQLAPAVKADLKEWKAFNKRHRNPIEPIIRWAYGIYLERNQQPQGVLSYDEVTGFLIAHYKKYGKL